MSRKRFYNIPNGVTSREWILLIHFPELTASLARVIWVVLLILPVFGQKLYAQISPGKLAAPHASLEGLTNCTKCHELGSGPTKDRCLACHGEIASRLKDKRGYHATIMNDNDKPCIACHAEHAGREFELVRWPDGRDNFNHDETGYRLQGKHIQLACQDCHKPVLIKEDLHKLQPNISLQRTFLGLQQNCLSCHFDEHRNQLGDKCTTCHNQERWEPAVGFAHDKTRFSLTGRHRDVNCSKCHPTLKEEKKQNVADRSYAKFVGLQFQQCSACHRDVHLGKLGSNCQRCHSTSGWKKVNAVRFDHEKTRYPLRGKHQSVDCLKCHKSGQMTGTLPFNECRDCHADSHRGQFVSREDQGRCESCHSEQGFQPALFSIEDHVFTKYPLTGSHLAVPCIACHKKEVNAEGMYDQKFRFSNTECETCHRDPHYGQFSKLKPEKQCRVCHNTGEWPRIEFDHSRDSRYPLEGAHAKVPCSGCHKELKRRDLSFILFRPINTNCKTCHSQSNLKL